MKYTTALLALAAAVSAQDISIFPECSLDCIIKGIGSGTSCELTDFACVCENTESLVKEATPCVLGACGAEVALNEVLPAVEKFCAGVGGGDDGGDDEPSVTTTPAPEPTEPPAEEESDDEDAEPSPTGSFGSFITPGPTGNATIPPPPEQTTAPPVTAGAAVMGYMGSLGMLALGAVAAL
ncbi:hypothetical protein QBC40DRAFT_304616 [Triangularia verruculosa]|uniref:CFEM domain-containing protein n=1 Tax=Triangularia verruculosa TaxID=2587418 RepID=A0AAN7AXA8_9PEZI|nr:hypothetical protein QBC40DRAFT_304616 [Triangularia verruculosa]